MTANQSPPARPDALCSDCPPVGHSHKTRCLSCPRREFPVTACSPARPDGDALAIADEIEMGNGLILMTVLGTTKQLGIKKTAQVIAALRATPPVREGREAIARTNLIRDSIQRVYDEMCIKFSGVHSDDQTDSWLLNLHASLKLLSLPVQPGAGEREWRTDLENAPKDGSRVLLFAEGCLASGEGVVVGHWYKHPSTEGWITDAFDCGDYEFNPTQWKLLDAPPSSRQPPQSSSEAK